MRIARQKRNSPVIGALQQNCIHSIPKQCSPLRIEKSPHFTIGIKIFPRRTIEIVAVYNRLKKKQRAHEKKGRARGKKQEERKITGENGRFDCTSRAGPRSLFRRNRFFITGSHPRFIPPANISPAARIRLARPCHYCALSPFFSLFIFILTPPPPVDRTSAARRRAV